MVGGGGGGGEAGVTGGGERRKGEEVSRYSGILSSFIDEWYQSITNLKVNTVPALSSLIAEQPIRITWTMCVVLNSLNAREFRTGDGM